MYETNELAVVNGKGHSLAIGNGSVMQAIFGLPLAKTLLAQEKETSQKEIDERGYFMATCSLKHAWVRPHDGPGNPHTRADPQL